MGSGGLAPSRAGPSARGLTFDELPELRQTRNVMGGVMETTPELFYRVSPANGGLVFAERSRAEFVAQIHRAFEDSRIWDDFRKAMPPDEYASLLQQFDELGDPRPLADDEFEVTSVGAYCDGDYPPWLQAEMGRLLPEEVLREFGRVEVTAINGNYWHIEPGVVAPLVRRLRELGFRVEHAPDLKFH